MAKKKEKVSPIAAPSKIVNVVFTIPTAFSYESVKVEYSGLADTNEIVEKYNELVDTFRPKPKPVEYPIAKKALDKPWHVERKQYDEDGEEIVKQSEKVAEFKQKIKDEVDGLVLVPITTAAEYISYVQENTGLDLKDQNIGNLEAILFKLQEIVLNKED